MSSILGGLSCLLQMSMTMGRYEEKDIEFVKRLLNDRENMDSREIGEWLNIPRNRELLDNVAAFRYHSIQENIDKKGEDIPLNRIRGIKRYIGRWLVAASVILVAGGMFLQLWKWKTDVNRGVTEIAQGKHNRVELILATGTHVALDGKNNTIEGSCETGIREDSVIGLDYSEASITGDEEVFNTLKVPVGGFYTLQLEDKTKVWINSLTVLRFPVAFTEKVRKVYLEGEAYFEVAHCDSLPFVVVTDELEVKVYGTEFNVNAYKNTRTKVVLVDGSVGVRVPALGKEIGLQPNQMAEYARGMGTLQISEVEPYPHIAWKDGEFVFDCETVEEIMERLARWYDIRVFYANEVVKRQMFSGIINRFERIEEILRLIEEVAIVRFEVKGNTVVVKPME